MVLENHTFSVEISKREKAGKHHWIPSWPEAFLLLPAANSLPKQCAYSLKVTAHFFQKAFHAHLCLTASILPPKLLSPKKVILTFTSFQEATFFFFFTVLGMLLKTILEFWIGLRTQLPWSGDDNRDHVRHSYKSVLTNNCFSYSTGAQIMDGEEI